MTSFFCSWLFLATLWFLTLPGAFAGNLPKAKLPVGGKVDWSLSTTDTDAENPLGSITVASITHAHTLNLTLPCVYLIALPTNAFHQLSAQDSIKPFVNARGGAILCWGTATLLLLKGQTTSYNVVENADFLGADSRPLNGDYYVGVVVTDEWGRPSYHGQVGKTRFYASKAHGSGGSGGGGGGTGGGGTGGGDPAPITSAYDNTWQGLYDNGITIVLFKIKGGYIYDLSSGTVSPTPDGSVRGDGTLSWVFRYAGLVIEYVGTISDGEAHGTYLSYVEIAGETIPGGSGTWSSAPRTPVPPRIISQPQTLSAVKGGALSLKITLETSDPDRVQPPRVTRSGAAFRAPSVTSTTTPAPDGRSSWLTYTLTWTNLGASDAGSWICSFPLTGGKPVATQPITVSVVAPALPPAPEAIVGTPVLDNHVGPSAGYGSGPTGGGAPPPGIPTISSPPRASSFTPGTPLNLSVGVVAARPVQYQWYYGSTPLPGETGDSLRIDNPQATHAGGYHVVVTNRFGSVSTPPVTVELRPADAAPVITAQPADATKRVGDSLTLAVTATGYPPPTYQWYRGASLLPGATTATLSLSDLTVAQSGAYTVRVANAKGSVTSRKAAVVVLPHPPVVTSSASAAGRVGLRFTHPITATNSPTRYTAAPLPGGIALNAKTGVLSGTPKTAGVYPLTVTATNSGGVGTALLTLSIAPAPPSITSPATASARVGVAFSYKISASSPPVTYAVDSLPPGLSLDPATGLVSGVPATPGVFTLTLRATNVSGTGTRTLKLTIAPAIPVITSPLDATARIGQTFAYSIQASHAPTRFSATPLPPGLAFNASTGLLSGQPAKTGPYVVNLGATNTAGTGRATLTLVVLPPPPAITSPGAAGGRVGLPFSYQITASPAASSFGLSPVPFGLLFDADTGLLSGTPTTAGVFTLALSAANPAGSGSSTLTLTIAPAPPAITGPLTASGRVGLAFSYQIGASPAADSFSATPLPDGLVFNPASGLISGTPTVAGSFTLHLAATNISGSGSATLLLSIAPPPPAITSPGAAGGRVGLPFSYQITASPAASSFGLSPVPSGLHFDADTGLLSGTPTTAGVFTLALSAANPAGSGSSTLTLTIAPAPPAITGPLTASGRVGLAFSYQIGASPAADSFSATPLPDGLVFNPASGLISGTPTVAGSFTLHLAATNISGSGSATLLLSIAPPPPEITSPAAVSGQVNKPFSYQIQATHAPAVYAASPLPPGIVLDSATGILSGIPTHAGEFALILSATNAGGTTTFPLALAISPPAPLITSSRAVATLQGRSFTYVVTADHAPASFTAAPLPGWLTFNPATHTLSGTPSIAATHLITLTATNAHGGDSATLSLSVLAPTYIDPTLFPPVALLGQPFVWPLSTTTPALDFSSPGLPAWLALEAAAGIVSGTPTTLGIYSFDVWARNAAGATPTPLSLEIADYRNPWLFTLYAEGVGANAPAFNYPRGLALDPTGNLYVLETDSGRVRKITPDGVATILAANLPAGAPFSLPEGIAYSPSDDCLFIANTNRHVISRLTFDGVVTTFAGKERTGGLVDGTGADARLNGPTGISTGPDGALYILDNALSPRLSRLELSGRLTTIACFDLGLGSFPEKPGYPPPWHGLNCLAAGPDGNLYVANSTKIFRVTPAGIVSTYAGRADARAVDGARLAAGFGDIRGLAAGPDGTLYVADNLMWTVRRISPEGVVTTLAGRPKGFDIPGLPFPVGFRPLGIALDSDGALFISDTLPFTNHRIYRGLPAPVLP